MPRATVTSPGAGARPALLWAASVVLYRRVRHATPAGRRVLVPVVATAALSIALIAALLITSSVDRSAAHTLNWFVLASFAMVPVGFLVGLLQSRLARTGILRMIAEI